MIYQEYLTPLPDAMRLSLKEPMAAQIRTEYRKQLDAMLLSDEPFEDLYFAPDYADIIPEDIDAQDKAYRVSQHWRRIASRIDPSLCVLIQAVEFDALGESPYDNWGYLPC